MTALHCKGHGETCSVVVEMNQEVLVALVDPRVAAGRAASGRGRCCSRQAAEPRSLKPAEIRNYPSR